MRGSMPTESNASPGTMASGRYSTAGRERQLAGVAVGVDPLQLEERDAPLGIADRDAAGDRAFGSAGVVGGVTADGSGTGSVGWVVSGGSTGGVTVWTRRRS